jgi:hypothetical protein
VGRRPWFAPEVDFIPIINAYKNSYPFDTSSIAVWKLVMKLAVMGRGHMELRETMVMMIVILRSKYLRTHRINSSVTKDGRRHMYARLASMLLP